MLTEFLKIKPHTRLASPNGIHINSALKTYVALIYCSTTPYAIDSFHAMILLTNTGPIRIDW